MRARARAYMEAFAARTDDFEVIYALEGAARSPPSTG